MAAEFEPVEVPSRIADLGFSFLKPKDFHALQLPEEEVKFEDPTYFLPLMVCMAGYGAVVFSVAARPAFEDGCVEDWVRFVASKQEGEVIGVRRGVVGGLQAVVVEATQPSEAGQMRVRSHFIEDGGRLVILGTLAPEQVWGSVEEILMQMVGSFRLATPRGQKATVMRPPTPLPTAIPDGKFREHQEAQEDAAAAEEAVAAPAEDDADRPTTPAEVALADNAASLDAEHPMNARLRDNGVGLVPRVLEVNVGERFARLGAAAISSVFRVPLGWHVIDDGKRTLVFDAEGKVQVNLNMRHWGGDANEVLGTILQGLLEEQPGLDHMRLELGGMECLALRGLKSGDEVLEQAYLLKDVGREGLVLVTRVTASQGEMVRALNVAEVVLGELRSAG
jgi:hypothetical protein